MTNPAKIGVIVVTIDVSNSNSEAPIWDISIPTMTDGTPAIFRHAYAAVVEASAITKQQKLVARLAFSADPTTPPSRRRIALLVPGSLIDGEEVQGAEYLGCFVHPSGVPCFFYELPIGAEEKPELDVVAALAAVQRSKIDAIDTTDVEPAR